MFYRVEYLNLWRDCAEMIEKNPYPPLPESYKAAYPFTLATTSFIYPDLYAPNARMLGPFVDEIELLFFDSTYSGSLPSENQIAELGRLGEMYDLTYNVHLPTDVCLTAPDRRSRKTAVENIRTVLELTEPLHPSSSVLHLPVDGGIEENAWDSWLDRVREGIAEIRKGGLNTGKIAVETLNYPLERAMPIVEEFDLSICMDIGHLLLYGFDPTAFFERHADRIRIIHLHGVRDGKDHLALDQLDERRSRMVVDILNRFKGVVSLEVFSYKTLALSLDYLAHCWKGYGENP